MLVCWDEGGRRNCLFVWHNEKEIRCFYWWERSIKSCEMCGFASAVHLVSKHRTLTLRHTVLLSLSVFSLFWPLKTFQMMCKLYQCSQNSVFSSFTLYWPQLVPTRLAFLSTLQNLCIQCNTVFSCRLNCSCTICFILSVLNNLLTRYNWGYSSHSLSIHTHQTLLSRFNTFSCTLVAWESIH